ncbi:MAG: 30S ribosomal protein S16 [Bacteroidetes bacterium]|nr:30S ribosomal protein S16 [Bacteroidota bacterium]
MPVKIRLARHGKKHQAYYHIVVADGRAPRDGKFIEVIGKYNPNTNPATIHIDDVKALEWLSKGAQPTDTTKAILSYKGIMFKRHLQNGIAKGLLNQEQADEKFQKWMEDKHNKIAEKKARVAGESSKTMEGRLAEEAKKREAIAEKVRIKNTPPPVEETPVVAEGEAPAADAPSEGEAQA